MKVELLKWDSDFFGVKTGKLVLKKGGTLNTGILKEWDLIYIFVEPDDKNNNQLLKDMQVSLVDEKVTYLMDISNSKVSSELQGIFSYTQSENDDQVIRIGVQSGIYSRFYVDPKIGKEKFQDLYTTLMKKSINRELAKEVIIYKTDNEKIAAVATIGEENNRADIGVIAVDEKFHGQNIGKSLIQGVINYSSLNGYSLLQVVTQKMNLGACKFYEHCGFKPENVINIYHFWN